MSESPAGESTTGPAYYRLTVKAVREETSEARSFVLAPERGEASFYNYAPGQFLSFRIPHNGGMIVRSYSLSSAPSTDPDMTVCVKRVADGRGSNWFNDRLTAGARIEATRPAGRFTLRDKEVPLFLIAGGSGITPCISLIKQALVETKRSVKLVYANQNAGAVIYSETLDMLESRFAERFTCQHWFDDARGFLTAEDIAAAAAGWTSADSYICGPGPLMDMAEDTLAALFGADARILTERFVSPDDPAPDQSTAEASSPSTEVLIEHFKLTLDGEDHVVPITSGQTLLQAALAAGIDAPNSCTEGHCGTCMAWLRSGDVSMISTEALSKRDIERGHVLACQSRPSSADPIVLDFDI
ncbi:MAG: ferredoxin--NADP reductase [Gammaproteobacteria bacterium]|nr:ferredoxin--NADP reductase [Gammaproteobacteria bacterium]